MDNLKRKRRRPRKRERTSEDPEKSDSDDDFTPDSSENWILYERKLHYQKKELNAPKEIGVQARSSYAKVMNLSPALAGLVGSTQMAIPEVVKTILRIITRRE